jgi:uncharacterized protein (DUF58 family)
VTVHTPAVLRRVELTIRRRVHGLRHGDHLTLLRGRGIEAGDTRLYAAGDDVRRIDWAVTARTGQPHVRDAVAERELDVAILLDLSGSLDFGTADWRKRDLALAVTAAIGSLAVWGQDRVAALILDGEGLHWMPPRGGRSHLAAIVDRAEASGGGAIDLAAAMERLAALARRRGLVVIVSDFLGQQDWVRPMRVLGHRHQVLAVELVDPRELRLPDVGWITMEDPETGRRRTVDTSRPGIRLAIAAEADRRRAATATAVRGAGASHLRLRTDEDWVAALVRHLTLMRRAEMAGHRVVARGGIA